MKKFKFLPLILALSLLIPVLALTACTDNENTNNTNKLNSVEKNVVGTWENGSGYKYTLKSDKTAENQGGLKGEFYNDRRSESGKYNVIVITLDGRKREYAFYDNDRNTLVPMYAGMVGSPQDNNTLHRV